MPMSEAVIAALITGGVALLGNIITTVSNNKLTTYKIDELKDDVAKLSDRVDRYNNLKDRMVAVEQSAKSAHHRIDEMRGEHHG